MCDEGLKKRTKMQEIETICNLFSSFYLLFVIVTSVSGILRYL